MALDWLTDEDLVILVASRGYETAMVYYTCGGYDTPAYETARKNETEARQALLERLKELRKELREAAGFDGFPGSW